MVFATVSDVVKDRKKNSFLHKILCFWVENIKRKLQVVTEGMAVST